MRRRSDNDGKIYRKLPIIITLTIVTLIPIARGLGFFNFNIDADQRHVIVVFSSIIIVLLLLFSIYLFFRPRSE